MTNRLRTELCGIELPLDAESLSGLPVLACCMRLFPCRLRNTAPGRYAAWMTLKRSLVVMRLIFLWQPRYPLRPGPVALRPCLATGLLLSHGLECDSLSQHVKVKKTA